MPAAPRVETRGPLRSSSGLPWTEILRLGARGLVSDFRDRRQDAALRHLPTAHALDPRLHRPVFIIGAPRSGTTFLGSSIGRMPEISYHLEPRLTKAAARCVYDGSWSELNVYIPILVLGAIAAAFAVGSVVLASLVGPARYNKSKQAAYECGIEPTETSVSGPDATPGQRFPVKYYLTAMLFIVFDIEIVFLYPWAVAYDALGTFALVEMALFMLTVLVAYAYVWRRGGLTWD